MARMSEDARRMRRTLAASGCLSSGFPSSITPVSPGVPRDMGTQTYSLTNPNYRPPLKNRPAPSRPSGPPPPAPQLGAASSQSSQRRIYDLNETLPHRPLFRAFGKRVKRDIVSAAQATGKAIQVSASTTASVAQAVVSATRNQMGI